MRHAFTLIELLVVVTIIVVLLAILTPAIDKAIYQAELVSCGTSIRGTITGATQYAMDQKRHYPYRGAIRPVPPQLGYYPRPNLVRFKSDDDLGRLDGYLQLDLMLDPLSGRNKISLDESDLDSTTYTNYYLWWDWGYPMQGGGARSTRLGQGFSWQGADYSVLVTDEDYPIQSWASRIHSSHPDVENTAGHQVTQDGTTPLDAGQKWTLSRWNGARGHLDVNHGFQDGAVIRVPATSYHDSRMAKVPLEPFWYNPDIYIQIAR
jgi:prepilin-type N-terminal cleavage/methylation domain-containing protein